MGTFKITDCIKMENIILPEFDHDRRIKSQTALAFDGPHTCDIVWGRDFLHRTGMTLNFEQKNITWLDKTISMKNEKIVNDETFLTLDEMHPQAHFFCQEKDNLHDEWDDCIPTDNDMFNASFYPWE